MISPALAWGHFLTACLLGAGLGLVYNFLRPLRPRFTALSDLLFLGVLGYTLVYLFFGVCAGDIRGGYALGLAAGGFAWEWTLGRLISPVFAGFWKALGHLFRALGAPWKKFFQKKSEKTKIFLCKLGKMGYNKEE